ncbi:unnamed protein product [Bursaphelenchus okinawaensis]|uniref:BPI2 domain-containing protein n=1 Tax=Bursaphelenchus okinawaensis TaxID=465554 RepID=A0A811JQJ6_9BILA|nr:unnamed protein product [Bursaphelenchus okinawaensis]CAG9078277.1 unnamed protein product [Bursaphelenchus okinawaensis]
MSKHATVAKHCSTLLLLLLACICHAESNSKTAPLAKSPPLQPKLQTIDGTSQITGKAAQHLMQHHEALKQQKGTVISVNHGHSVPHGQSVPHVVPNGQAVQRIVPNGQAVPHIVPNGQAVPHIVANSQPILHTVQGAQSVPHSVLNGQSHSVPNGRSLPVPTKPQVPVNGQSTVLVNNGQPLLDSGVDNKKVSQKLSQKAASEGLPSSFRQASQQGGKDKTQPGSKAHGYQTQQYASTEGGSCGAGSCANGVNGGYGGQQFSSIDYNPLLAGGVPGGPGIKARINSRGFQYASALIAPILDQQIRRARIPTITQRIEQINGCITVYNLYVSRYRCPQRVVLYPAPPNQIVLAVQNLDVGVTGNLAGTANILIPIPISGIIEVNAHQVSVTVALVVERAATGGIRLRLASCQASIGYLDAYIVNGGLIGDLANGMFRGQISSQIRNMLPGELCNRLPGILDSEVNSKLGGIPQSISLTQILSAVGGAMGIQSLLAGAAAGGSGGQCPSRCGGGGAPVQAPISAPISAPVSAPVGPAPIPLPPVGAAVPYQAGPSVPISAPVGSAVQYKVGPAAHAAPKAQSIPLPTNSSHSGDNLTAINSKKVQRFHVSGVSAVQAARPLPRPDGFDARGRRVARAAPKATVPVVIESRNKTKAKAFASGSVQFANDPNICAGCPSSGGGNQLGFLSTLVQSLDLNKLNSLAITTQLLQTYATNNDYTIEINGEFSPNGQGGTPFGPFPMYFPYSPGSKMAEVLVSDYTINSLFYWLHRTGFLTFRIGPETPKIGELLRTTCADADDTLEDHGVEVDEELRRKHKRQTEVSPYADFARLRTKRQDTSLTDLGICFGDILPAIRERYPNQRIVISIRTRQAPSIVLSQRNGGTVTLDLIADAEIYIESTNQRVGAITISAAADIIVSTYGGRISGSAQITRLQLNDYEGTLGLPQDALDNLGSLGKEVIQKAANDALQNGIALNIPSGIGGLPITFVQPEFHIVEHALHIESDFTVDPAGLQSLLGGGGGGFGGSCRR